MLDQALLLETTLSLSNAFKCERKAPYHPSSTDEEERAAIGKTTVSGFRKPFSSSGPSESYWKALCSLQAVLYPLHGMMLSSLEQPAFIPPHGAHCAGRCVPYVVGPLSSRPRYIRQQLIARPESTSCSGTPSRAARGRIHASGANGTEGGEALLQLADRQVSSSTAGPSHNSSYKNADEPIRQHFIPEGNPNLATLVGHIHQAFSMQSQRHTVVMNLSMPCIAPSA